TSCYQCLLDYGNQRVHPYLDRFLARDLIKYTLTGDTPSINEERMHTSLQHLLPFISDGYELAFDVAREGTRIPALLTVPSSSSAASIWPMHSLEALQPDQETNIAVDTGTAPIFVREFDLVRRPFWIWNQILAGTRGLIQ